MRLGRGRGAGDAAPRTINSADSLARVKHTRRATVRGLLVLLRIYFHVLETWPREGDWRVPRGPPFPLVPETLQDLSLICCPPPGGLRSVFFPPQG